MRHLVRPFVYGLALLALPPLAMIPAHAAAPAEPPGMESALAAAAENGPGALLAAVDRILAANPSLAATPQQAAAFARLAAAPVNQFVGANMPVYREIEAKIVAAAPAAQQAAVRRAVGGVLAGYVEADVRLMPPPQPRSLGTTPPPTVDTEAAGYRVGDFTIYPSIQAGTLYDDNIYATPTNKVPDMIGTVSPRIAVQSNWDRHSLYAEAGADLTGYWTHSSENTVDWHALMEGRIDVSKNTAILLGGAALQEHEDRASPDAVEGLTPTLYHEYDAYAGVTHRFDTYSLRVGTAIQHLTFDNVQGLYGEINNQDRNRTRYTFGFLLRDDARQSFRPYVEALGDLRQYDQQPDDFGYYRNSSGFRAGVGAKFSILPKVTGEASVGVMARYYDDPSFNPVVTPAASAYLRWEPRESTAVVLFLDRSIEETTLPGSPAYIYTVVGGRLEQQLAERWRGIIRLAYSASVFAQSPRVDSEGDMSIGVRYQLTPRLVLGLDYRYTERVSTDSIYNFNRNQVFLQVTSAF
jgi:hypothetical protein